jgi:hypothetical protein
VFKGVIPTEQEKAAAEYYRQKAVETSRKSQWAQGKIA